MNIAILTDRYFPTPVSGAVLMHDMALELVSQKHNVLVLTGDSQIKSNFEIRKENGIKILRVKVLNQKSLSLPRRLLFELFLQKKIWKIFFFCIYRKPIRSISFHQKSRKSCIITFA